MKPSLKKAFVPLKSRSALNFRRYSQPKKYLTYFFLPHLFPDWKLKAGIIKSHQTKIASSIALREVSRSRIPGPPMSERGISAWRHSREPTCFSLSLHGLSLISPRRWCHGRSHAHLNVSPEKRGHLRHVVKLSDTFSKKKYRLKCKKRVGGLY